MSKNISTIVTKKVKRVNTH